MSGTNLKVTNTIDQSAQPGLRIDDAPREANERNLISDFAGPIIVFILFIGFWYLLSTKLLPPQKRFLLPTPHRVIDEGFLTWSAGTQRGLKPILMSLWDSIKIAVSGLIITIIVGTTLATLMATRRWMERATWPYLVALQSAPILAMTPLIRALIEGIMLQRILVVVLIGCNVRLVNKVLSGCDTIEKTLLLS